MAIFSKWKFLALILVIPLVVLVALACGDDDDDGSAEVDAEAALCADLATLQAADAAFDDLSTASTIDDLEAANQAYSDALDDVVSSANDLGEIRSQPIEDAYDDLNSAINDIPGDATIAEGLDSISAALAAVDAAYVEAFSGLACA